ncbi:hypothetical protein SAMN05444279_12544 [Ruegeria intermedia]|uniref:Uncharacterized protein n=1 Tax=Ruegeria intermedia TaxID=996115 RepID=A0A1M5AF56_9RHOB|nr:hypothetical protein [Ruegeria intermedia]SHF28775.1 hypothetical protein SAMN05444279_12544 [Ruegeria intermedia]
MPVAIWQVTQNEGSDMKLLGIVLMLAVLAACETANPQASRPVEEPARSGPGVSVSGYARVGVSKTF